MIASSIACAGDASMTKTTNTAVKNRRTLEDKVYPHTKTMGGLRVGVDD